MHQSISLLKDKVAKVLIDVYQDNETNSFWYSSPNFVVDMRKHRFTYSYMLKCLKLIL